MAPSLVTPMLACVALLAAEPARAQQPLFLGSKIKSSAYAQDALLADFDGDGHLDLAAVGGEWPLTVILQLGDGAGGLGSMRMLAVPATPWSLAAGDVDGDGDLDLAVGTVDAAHVYPGDGQGSFGAPVTLQLGGEIHDIGLEDLDGDGALDLLAAGWDPVWQTAHHVWTSLGDGQGNFGPVSAHDVASFPRALTTSDLDNDGNLDLLAAMAWTDSVAVLRGDGQGGFAPPQPHAAGSTPWSIEVADMDGDGDPDVVVPNRVTAGTVTVLLNDGQGGLAAPLAFDAGRDPIALELLDLDGDGWLDVAAACQGILGVQSLGALTLLHGTGAGALGPAQTFYSGQGALYLTSGDLDEDGAVDLLLGDVSSWATWYRGDPQGGILAASRLPSGTGPWSYPWAARARDLDADGLADLVVANTWEDGVAVHLADGAGGFLPPVAFSTGASPADVQVADLDGDTRLDLLVADEGDDEVVFLRGNGSGAFRLRARHAVDTGPRSIALGDVNLDGHLDAVVACGTANRLSVLLGDGQGGFSAVASVATPEGPEEVVLTDLDRDTRLDCVVACMAGRAVVVLAGDGAGGFAATITVALPGSATSVVACDLDRDGFPDVSVAQYGGPSLTVLLGDGQGGLSSATTPWIGYDVMSLAAGDLDGDGFVDLAAATWHAFQPLFVLLGDGQGGFEEPLAFAVGKGSSCVALGDLDGDGNQDLVVANADSHDLTVLRNQLPAATACSDQVPYCRAKANSSGCLPRICSSGSPTLSGPDDFVLTADRVLTHNLGLLFWGLAPAATPFGAGTLCVGGQVTRAWVGSAGGPTGVHDCSGTYVFPVSQAYLAAQGLSAGTQVFAQVWMRDPLLPAPYSYCLTNGLAFTVAP